MRSIQKRSTSLLLAILLAIPALGFSQEPAALERLRYADPQVTVDLGVGLWAWPIPLDFDLDGDFDLLVSCPDKPSNGTYFFENTGRASELDPAMPIFEPGVRIACGFTNILPSYFDQLSPIETDLSTWGSQLANDSGPLLLVPEKAFTNFRAERDARSWDLGIKMAEIHQANRLRHRLWKLADLDADGHLDLVVGVEEWDDYGWDDGYDSEGNWLKEKLHGWVYWIRNTGSLDRPQWQTPVQLLAGDDPIDTFGIPTPNLIDWDSDGDLDLLCGEFLDGFTYFKNEGSAQTPRFAPGVRLNNDAGEPLVMDLQMIIPVAFDWDRDGNVDLIVGDEDGRVAWIRCLGVDGDDVPRFAAPRYFQQRGEYVKFGALVTPTACDWDGDGDQDLVCGNTAGYVAWIENIEAGYPPRFAPPKKLLIGNEPLRIQAGPNGSIQGPAEAKWGYTTQTVADWDGDGHLDLVLNSIWGRVQWCKGHGSDDPLQIDPPQSVEVAWETYPPKPAWTWFEPSDRELVTQWRTTPVAFDWNRDGLCDLVMLDPEGYLVLYERERRDGESLLLPPQRIFSSLNANDFDSGGTPSSQAGGQLRLNNGERGRSGRRKLCLADWNGDGQIDLLVNSNNADWFLGSPAENGNWNFDHQGSLSSFPISGHTTSPTTTDFNSDGALEAVIGAEDGYLYFVPAPIR